MDRYMFDIGVHGDPKEFPKVAKSGDRLALIEYDIENLSRCSHNLIHKVEELEAELEALRTKQ